MKNFDRFSQNVRQQFEPADLAKAVGLLQNPDSITVGNVDFVTTVIVDDFLPRLNQRLSGRYKASGAERMTREEVGEIIENTVEALENVFRIKEQFGPKLFEHVEQDRICPVRVFYKLLNMETLDQSMAERVWQDAEEKMRLLRSMVEGRGGRDRAIEAEIEALEVAMRFFSIRYAVGGLARAAARGSW